MNQEKKITTGVITRSFQDFKRLNTELKEVCEFRNQLTLDTGTFEIHSRLTLKAVGEARQLLELLSYVVRDNHVTWLKEDGKLKTVEIIPTKK